MEMLLSPEAVRDWAFQLGIGGYHILYISQLLYKQMFHVYRSSARSSFPPFVNLYLPKKTKAVRDWALQLRLGGYAKIGWPGVCVCVCVCVYV